MLRELIFIAPSRKGLKPIIGIDVGKSNSAELRYAADARLSFSAPKASASAARPFPSYVALTADGQVLVGEPARRQMTVNPEGTTTAFKRLMGRREKVRLRNREFSPEELSGFLFG